MHPKLMLKIFFLLFLFGFKTLNAQAPSPSAEVTENFSVACLNMKKEMEKIENKKVQTVNLYTEIVYKEEFSDYIFEKIDFLMKMVKIFVPNDRNPQQNSFFTDDSVREMQYFSNYMNIFNKERFQRGLMAQIDFVGRNNIREFLDLLEGLSRIELTDHIKNLKFGEMKETMIDFIKKLKIEIIFGQTYKLFNEMGKKIKDEKYYITKEIAKAEKTSLFEAGEFKKNYGYNPSDFKKLYLKYNRLNDLSLELYNILKEIKIPKMLKKGKTNKITIEWNTILLGKKFKNAFDQIRSYSKTMLTNYWLEPLEEQSNSNKKPADYIDPKKVVANRNFDGPTWLDYIEYNLSLPDQWVEKETELLKPKQLCKDIKSVTRATVRLNAGVLLMALERMKKFF